jgi:hypothetical protein
MNSPEANLDRLDTYRRGVERLTTKGTAPARINYLLANLALDELKISVERAEEPSEASFKMVAKRFDEASSGTNDIFQVYRSQILKAWIRPIVWSDIINLGTLSNGEAKRVAENIRLGEAADATATVAKRALVNFDRTHRRNGSPRVQQQLSGFLTEATPLLLASRHTTAKAFAVPTTQYDDEMNPERSLHTDAIYFDNRPQRERPKVPFQIESRTGSHTFIDPSIPIINGHGLGNHSRASRWPKDDRPFMTLRHLIDERIGDGVDTTTSSQLDRINSAFTATVLGQR